jgi:hypothetical protein
MKKVFLVIGLALFTFSYSNAQCNSDSFTTSCIPQLAAGFNFLKGYKIDGLGGQKAKVEYSYVFTKGTQYMINICSGTAEDIVINLFDSQRNKVASSKIGNQYATAIAFPCKATSIYYISYTFSDSGDYCGGSALGFKKS